LHGRSKGALFARRAHQGSVVVGTLRFAHPSDWLLERLEKNTVSVEMLMCTAAVGMTLHCGPKNSLGEMTRGV